MWTRIRNYDTILYERSQCCFKQIHNCLGGGTTSPIDYYPMKEVLWQNEMHKRPAGRSIVTHLRIKGCPVTPWLLQLGGPDWIVDTRVSQNLPQICTASAWEYHKFILKQMKYSFAVNFGTLSIIGGPYWIMHTRNGVKDKVIHKGVWLFLLECLERVLLAAWWRCGLYKGGPGPPLRSAAEYSEQAAGLQPQYVREKAD